VNLLGKLSVLLFASAFAILNPCRAEDTNKKLRLFFPTLRLKPNEAVSDITVTVTCAHVESIVHIPGDWYVSLERNESPESAIFRAGAGHGVSYLPNIATLNGMLRINNIDRACFEVSVLVTVFYDEEREIKLSQSDLKLIP
jgi:hypothetical protein